VGAIWGFLRDPENRRTIGAIAAALVAIASFFGWRLLPTPSPSLCKELPESDPSIEGAWRSEWPSDLTATIFMREGCKISAVGIANHTITGSYDPGNNRYPYTVIRVDPGHPTCTFYGHFYVINSHEMFSHVYNQENGTCAAGAAPLQEGRYWYRQ
jgi:hypothetical protein